MNYVFLDVSVVFRICFSLSFLGLWTMVRLMEFGSFPTYDDPEVLWMLSGFALVIRCSFRRVFIPFEG